MEGSNREAWEEHCFWEAGAWWLDGGAVEVVMKQMVRLVCGLDDISDFEKTSSKKIKKKNSKTKNESDSWWPVGEKTVENDRSVKEGRWERHNQSSTKMLMWKNKKQFSNVKSKYFFNLNRKKQPPTQTVTTKVTKQ